MSDDRTLDFNPDDDRTYPLAEEQGSGGSDELIPGEDPDKIGPYRLVRRIGEGGMGVVYEAEQIEPIRRKVALKVIKRGMDTAEFVARFEAERQALAMMDHPSIAQVFDAGATERGRPYFVMEYVEGVPITDYCDEHKLIAARAPRAVHPGLRGRAARPPEGDHPPRPEAVERPGRPRSTASPCPRSSTSASPRPWTSR